MMKSRRCANAIARHANATASNRPQNAAATALELGHHDSRITFAHYRELVKPKEAARFWQIKLSKASRKIARMEAAP